VSALIVMTQRQSADSTDQLIRELIVTGREPSRAEKRRILDRVASTLSSRATLPDFTRRSIAPLIHLHRFSVKRQTYTPARA
jgi:hypothetical protein